MQQRTYTGRSAIRKPVGARQLPLPLDRARYPHQPGHKVLGTSRDAAARIAPAVPTLRQRALEVIRKADTPPTADEIAHELGASILSIRPRVAELHQLGEIRPADERGRNESGHAATRWEIAAPNGGAS